MSFHLFLCLFRTSLRRALAGHSTITRGANANPPHRARIRGRFSATKNLRQKPLRFLDQNTLFQNQKIPRELHASAVRGSLETQESGQIQHRGRKGPCGQVPEPENTTFSEISATGKKCSFLVENQKSRFSNPGLTEHVNFYRFFRFFICFYLFLFETTLLEFPGPLLELLDVALVLPGERL